MLTQLNKFSSTYPCSMKNTMEMIRQIVEIAHPMYETICKALRSTIDICYQKKEKKTMSQKQGSDVLVYPACQTKLYKLYKAVATILWHPQQTCSPPATSTSTAKLVRWVLRHRTDVTFPTVVLLVVVTPSVTQLPEPTLCRKYKMLLLTQLWKAYKIILTGQRNSSMHIWIQLFHLPAWI